MIRDVLPSVVQIEARSDLGSGVVYDDAGHIVTNAHVAGDGTTFRVTAAHSEDPLAATLVSSYPEQDLALSASPPGRSWTRTTRPPEWRSSR